MIAMLLQSIGDSCYFSGNGLTCLLDQITSAFGGPELFGLVAGALIFVVFYVASEGDLATPTVALILSGTVFIPMLPGSYSQIAYGVVAIGLAAGVWQVLKQYVLSGAVR